MTDTRDGEHIIKSRIGLQNECVFMEDLVNMGDDELGQYDCVIVDEAQFCTKSQIEYLVHVVDDLNIPVICYGLRADFRNELFEGSLWLLAWADVIEEIPRILVCQCSETCTQHLEIRVEEVTLLQLFNITLSTHNLHDAIIRSVIVQVTHDDNLCCRVLSQK